MTTTVQGDAAALLNGKKTTKTDSPYVATGVILFTSMGQLLFMNNEAQAFIQQLQPLATRENGTCLIPEDVHSLVRDLISRLMECQHPKDCELIQVERLSFASEQRFLLRGICIPDEPLSRNSRLLIIMEKLHQRIECPDTNMQERYHLTEREQMVIIYLMLGFTNKEIANRLNLSEYTIKEHLKRIMQKTRTTTRTGLLARMIFPTPQVAGSVILNGTIPVKPAPLPAPVPQKMSAPNALV
jgi:DNA-binding CsgD family transcriptional regulator